MTTPTRTLSVVAEGDAVVVAAVPLDPGHHLACFKGCGATATERLAYRDPVGEEREVDACQAHADEIRAADPAAAGEVA